MQSGECTTAVYILIEDGSTIFVKNAEYDFVTGQFGGVEGFATCSKFSDIGSCVVKFDFLMPPGGYRVLSTDYTTYSIVYSCTPYLAGAICLNFLWVLSRAPYVPGSQASVDF